MTPQAWHEYRERKHRERNAYHPDKAAHDRRRADRLLRNIEITVGVFGALCVLAGVLLYAHTAPPLRADWSPSLLISAGVLVLSGVLLAALVFGDDR